MKDFLVAGIDPGPKYSSIVLFDGKQIVQHETVLNEEMLILLASLDTTYLAIEKVENYGMPVGESTFETVFWTGRFCQKNLILKRIARKEIKLHFCNSTRAKDSNIIQALKNRFEPNLLQKQRPKGILKKIVKDQWQALAIAVYYWDLLFSDKLG